MAAADTESSSATVEPLALGNIDNLLGSFGKIVLETEDDEDTSSRPTDAPRPFYIYTRAQALRLSKSPLVQCPQGMPDFKDWFGDWNEQSSTKKDSDASASLSNGRDRRFRRDADDTENSTARNFRTTLAQPSQMGNFRHQSTRTTERDREKGSGEDREAKDGQERLRSLSDKFDRDRLASNRLNGQSSLTNGARRTEAREPTKRRNGEASDDWRRGADPVRQGRDDKNEYRRDRDTRERPRSKVRDSSRGRRDTSASRRDRDHDDKDRDRARRFDREERDRPARGVDHYSPPRDRDDDSRRWRDDGKRDERMATKREREKEDKDKDRDNRWQTAEDRDSRLKRATGRDRKNADDGKDKDRRDDRDKDKEKEPAWMETYVPDASGGILGGRTADGEMDSIQAWKKGMKEKEEKDKATAAKDPPSGSQQDTAGQVEPQMDEIQLFKMMIKREADRKGEQEVVQGTNDPMLSLNTVRSQDDGSTKATTSPLTPSSTDPHSFVSFISSTPSDTSPSQPASANVSAPPLETQRSASRFFPNPLVQDPALASQKPIPMSTQSPAPEYNPPQTSRLLGLSSRTSSTSGSAKPQNAVENLTAAPQHPSQQLPPLQPDLGSRQSPDTQYRPRPDSALGLGRPDVIRQRDQSPFDQVHRGQFDDKDLYVQQFESQRRASGMSSVSSEGSFGDVGFIGNGGGSAIDLMTGTPNGVNYSSGKGSRFAKFFDNKGGRELQMVGGKPMLAGLTSPSPIQGHRPGDRVPSDSQGDPRTMDDIFAMLQNSANQGQRGGGQSNQVNQLYMLSQQQGNSYGQNIPVQQHHLAPNNRLDALYDSRFEDKSFVPDGMVPGLRSAVPPNRVREVGGLNYLPEHLDEQLQFGVNRPPPQHRNGELFGNNPQQIYAQAQQQQNFIRSGPLQQVPFRGNPSPIASQNPLQVVSQPQRLPPGLANLGGRPPHDSSQFFGNGIQQLQNHQNALPTHSNGLAQQQGSYPSFQGGNGLGVGGGGGPHIRLGHGQQQHHLQGLVGHNLLSGLGHSGSLDVRSGATQAQQQLLGGLQGVGGYGGQGQLSHAQLQAQLTLRQQQQRQQQQQQLLSQGMVPHLAHLQQSGGVHGHNQPAQDLMALLMGNSNIHRE